MKNLFKRGFSPLTISLLCLFSAVMLSGCTGNGTTTPEQFKKACESDGYTVTEDAEVPSSPEYDGLESYSYAEHGTYQILIQYMVFTDEEAAKKGFETYTDSVDPGEMGTETVTELKKYTVCTSVMDSYYSKAVLCKNQVITAKGPTFYTSTLNRIVLKFGYQ